MYPTLEAIVADPQCGLTTPCPKEEVFNDPVSVCIGCRLVLTTVSQYVQSYIETNLDDDGEEDDPLS